MNYNKVNGQYILKKIKKILEKGNLYLSKRLNLEYLKPKFFNCQIAIECKICLKRYKYELCKILR